MPNYIINKKSLNYLYCGDIKVKIYFNIIFVNDKNVQSNEQYYECDWDPRLSDEENNNRVEEQLMNAFNEYNGRNT
jgi:hypothetical protein